jgi:iron complex outermembrane receptor protein
MKRNLIVLILVIFGLNLNAQIKKIWINEVKIESQKTAAIYSESSRIISIITSEEIKQAPVQSVADLLEYAMNVDVRQRGYHGVQSDISIRGGSFDQILILINGIPFNDPQTGHHNADIPIDVENIERIEILRGPASRVFGPNAFSGAINIITTSPKSNKIKIGASYGSHGLNTEMLSGTYTSGKFINDFSISRHASDGYIENTDYKILNLHYQVGYKFKNSKLELQAAYQDKGFGANSFYTPKYPNQYEATKTYFISGKWKGGKKLKYKLSSYYKKHNDRFELFRTNPANWYTTHNYHQTHVYGFEGNLNFISSFGKTAIGATYRNEKVYSNKLGFDMDKPIAVGGANNVFYTKSDNRKNASFFIEHGYFSKVFNISAGVMANWNSAFDWEFFPGVDISVNLSNKFKLFASINKSYRLPTFTDLYYVGPTNIGNLNVQAEKAMTIEGGLKYITKKFIFEAAYFNRNGKNIIDWVRLSNNDKWESKNITELDTRGLEFSFVANSKLFEDLNLPVKRMRLSYSYIDVKKTSGDFISKYVLDYLKHKLSFNLSHSIVRNVNLNWQVSYQDRAGTYHNFTLKQEMEYLPFVIIDTQLNWQLNNCNIYLEATNLLNKSYFDIGNVMMPGRWIRAGFIFNINL